MRLNMEKQKKMFRRISKIRTELSELSLKRLFQNLLCYKMDS